MRVMSCAPCASVHAHCTCGWGIQSTCQKLCVVGLVGAQKTLQNSGSVKSEPNTCLVKTPVCAFHFWTLSCSLLPLLASMADFLSQSQQPSATFSTRFCTGLCQIPMLWRPSRAVLPVLHRQETSSRHLRVMNLLVTPEFLSVSTIWHSECDL